MTTMMVCAMKGKVVIATRTLCVVDVNKVRRRSEHDFL